MSPRIYKRPSVRDDELHCTTCKQWKPDEEFIPSGSKYHAHRRGRHQQCRACHAAYKAAWRKRTGKH